MLLAAIGAVSVHPQIMSVTLCYVGRGLVQACLPQDVLPAAADDVAVTRPAAQQHVHSINGTWFLGQLVVRAVSLPQVRLRTSKDLRLLRHAGQRVLAPGSTLTVRRWYVGGGEVESGA